MRKAFEGIDRMFAGAEALRKEGRVRNKNQITGGWDREPCAADLRPVVSRTVYLYEGPE